MPTCFECDAPADHAHHVVPASRGGRRTVPLCDRCHGLVHDLALVGHRELTKRALRERRSAGRRAGNVPYGYRARADGSLVPDPGEQRTIELARKARVEGAGLREIARRLNDAGCRTRPGGAFVFTRIRWLLRAAEREVTVVAFE